MCYKKAKKKNFTDWTKSESNAFLKYLTKCLMLFLWLPLYIENQSRLEIISRQSDI